MLTFQEMETRFGPSLAYAYLAEIEKSAAIPSWRMADLDPETRLSNAFRVQDAAQPSACAAAR